MKDLIAEHYPHGLIKYADVVGISINNIYASLGGGSRKVTIAWLNKLLSGIQHECISYQEFVIQPFETGQTADAAYYGELDDELLLEGTAALEQESTSSSSEKLPEKPKMPPESPSQEQPAESSPKPSPIRSFPTATP